MQQHYIISYIGADRPGLVDKISKLIQSVGGSWQSGRSANLAGMFSGMVHIDIPAENAAKLSDEVANLQTPDLQVSLHPIKDLSSPNDSIVEIKVIGSDRKGIVSELSGILSNLSINLEELATEVSPAPMSGELTFSAIARVSMPEGLSTDTVQNALEQLSDDLMVELTPI